MNNGLSRDFLEVYQNSEANTHDFEGKTILVAGGAGFLGSLFIKYFLYLNRTVLTHPCSLISIDNFLARDRTTEEDKFLTNIEHDLCIPLNLKLHNRKIDFIINCSGNASPYYYERYPLETMAVSTTGTQKMLELALAHNARILNFSSSEVLGTPDEGDIPTTEEYIPRVHTLDKRSCYDVTKMYIETLSYVFRDQFNLDCKVVRPFNIIGYFRQNDKRVIPNFVSSCIKNEQISVYLPGDQTRTFCWYGDFLAGCIKVLTKGRDLLYHIGNSSNEISMLDLALLVQKVCRKEDLVKTISTPRVYKYEPQRRCPSTEKIRKELDFKCHIDLEEGVSRIHEWALENYK